MSQHRHQLSHQASDQRGDHPLDEAADRSTRRAATGKRPRTPAAPVLPLSLLIEEYGRDLRRRNIAPKTIRDYQQVLHLALGFWQRQLGRPPTLDDVTARSAEAFLDHLLERGKIHWRHPAVPTGQPLARASLRTYVRTLKVFASWLADPRQAYTPENRLARLAMPRPDRTHKQPLTAEEIAALVGTCDASTLIGTRDQALVLTLLDAGLRASELIQLTVGHVHLDSGQLFIASGKGDKTRTVTVGENTKRALRRYALFREATLGAPASTEDAFFQTDAGGPFRYFGLRAWLVRLKQRAGVMRAFPHLLRHTSAVRTLEVPGSDLFTLKEKLGHADISTTLRYLHMTTEQLSARQRTFSPVDHLGIGGPTRAAPPEKTDGRLWHQRPRRGARTSRSKEQQ
jgi:integrase/recombinase XerC